MRWTPSATRHAPGAVQGSPESGEIARLVGTVTGQSVREGTVRAMTWWQRYRWGVPLVVAVVAIWLLHTSAFRLIDLAVYRTGAGDLWHGRSVYTERDGALPFTYPPFAAVLFVPWYAVGKVVAGLVAILGNIALYWLFVTLWIRRLPLPPRHRWWVYVAGAGMTPVWHTVGTGQVNLLLACLFMLDAWVVPPRHRGYLVGVITGIKLIPGVYVLWFVMRREWGAVGRSALGLAATIAVGALAAPHDSWHYWTKLVYDSNHVPSIGYVSNQSLNGVLIRAVGSVSPPTAAYLLLAAASVALAAYACWRELRASTGPADSAGSAGAAGVVGEHEVTALVALAMAGLLASPVSWAHHWVWLLPAAVVLGLRRHWVPAVYLVAVMAAAPFWWMPHDGGQRELHDSWWQQLVIASWAIGAVWFLVVVILDDRRGGRGADQARERGQRWSHSSPRTGSAAGTQP